MGRKAKLKKQRKSSSPSTTYYPDKFVENIERQGYSLKKLQNAPQLPENRPDPQV